MGKYVTIQDIEEWRKKMAASRKTTFDLPQGYIGNGWYRISDGCICNKAAYDAFQKELLRQGKQIKNEQQS